MMRDCQYTIKCDCGLGGLHKSQTISAFTPPKKIYYENLEDIENYIANIVNFIHDIRFSLYFNYYPQDVQELIDEFLNYSNQHFDAEYFEIHGIPFKNNEEYMELLNLLKEIYDNLKKEIGKNV